VFLFSCVILRLFFTHDLDLRRLISGDFRDAFVIAYLSGDAMFRREAAEIIRFGWVVVRDVPEPFNDSITEIA